MRTTVPLEFVTDSSTNERYVVPAGTRCELLNEGEVDGWLKWCRSDYAAKGNAKVIVWLGRKQRLVGAEQVE